MIVEVDVLPCAFATFVVPQMVETFFGLEDSPCSDQGRSPGAQQALCLREQLVLRVHAGIEDKETGVIHVADPHDVEDALDDWRREFCAVTLSLLDFDEDC